MNRISMSRNYMNHSRLVATVLSLILVQMLVFGAISATASPVQDTYFVQLKSDAQKVSSMVQEYMKPCDKSLRAISNSMFARNLMISPKKLAYEVENELDQQVTKNSKLMNAFIGYKTNRLMLISPSQQLPREYDPSERPWYNHAVTSKDGRFVETPYKDMLTGNTILTMTRSIKSSKTKADIGVAAIDYNITELLNQIILMSQTEDISILVFDKDMKLIATGSKVIQQSDSIAELQQNIKEKNNEKLVHIKIESADYATYLTTEAVTGWKILVLKK